VLRAARDRRRAWSCRTRGDGELMAAEAGRELARRSGRRQGRRRLGADRDGKAAARPERAAAIEAGQVGRLALDRIEPGLPRLVEPRYRTQQRDRVRVARVVVERRGGAAFDDAA